MESSSLRCFGLLSARHLCEDVPLLLEERPVASSASVRPIASPMLATEKSWCPCFAHFGVPGSGHVGPSSLEPINGMAAKVTNCPGAGCKHVQANFLCSCDPKGDGSTEYEKTESRMRARTSGNVCTAKPLAE